MPYHVALRAILDAETISDAYAVLQRASRSSSANYLIAHRDGQAVNIEGAPGDFHALFLTFPDEGLLLHTNHFVSGRLAGGDVGLWVMPDSPFRLDRLRAQIGVRRRRCRSRTSGRPWPTTRTIRRASAAIPTSGGIGSIRGRRSPRS